MKTTDGRHDQIVLEHLQRFIHQLQRIGVRGQAMLQADAAEGPAAMQQQERCEATSYLKRVGGTQRLLTALSPEEALSRAPMLSASLSNGLHRLRPTALRVIVTQELHDSNLEPAAASRVCESSGATAAEKNEFNRALGQWYFIALVASEVQEHRDVALAYLGANRALVDLTAARKAGLQGKISLAADPLLGAPVPTATQIEAAGALWCNAHRQEPEAWHKQAIAKFARFGVHGRRRQREAAYHFFHMDTCEDQFLSEFEIQQWLAFFSRSVSKGILVKVPAFDGPCAGTNPVARVLPNRLAARAQELAATEGLSPAHRQRGLALAADALALDLASRRDGILALRAVFLWLHQGDLIALHERLTKFQVDVYSHQVAPEKTPTNAAPSPPLPSAAASPLAPQMPPSTPLREAPARTDAPKTPAEASPAAASGLARPGRWITVGEGKEQVSVFSRLSFAQLSRRLREDVDPATFARADRTSEVAAAMSLAYHAGKHAPRGVAVEDYLDRAQQVFEQENPREVTRRSDRPGDYARVLRRSPLTTTWGVWSRDGRMISFCDATICPEEARRAD